MTTDRYRKAIDLVVAAYSRDGKRDIWNAVSFVQKELAALGAELDPALRSRFASEDEKILDDK